MHLDIRHTTIYRYSEDAWDSFNELCLRPLDDYRQTLLDFRLIIYPEAVVRSGLDLYGNTKHHFFMEEPHRDLRIEAQSKVVTYDIPTPKAVPADTLRELRHRFYDFLSPTRRVPLNMDWVSRFEAPSLAQDGEIVSYLEGLNRHLHTHFSYDPSSTEVDTPLADFRNKGVCQDYAHAMLAICRKVGIPARYVSGYIHANPNIESESLLGAQASHAWIEAFLPGNGWVGFDPTNGCYVNQAHVKTAYGRDYDDIPPIRGRYSGGGGDSSLEVEVRVNKSL